MNWLTSRFFWGSLLVLCGGIFLIQSLGILDLGALFSLLLQGLASVFFISIYLQKRS